MPLFYTTIAFRICGFAEFPALRQLGAGRSQVVALQTANHSYRLSIWYTPVLYQFIYGKITTPACILGDGSSKYGM